MNTIVAPSTIRLRGEDGFLLHGQFPGTYCFVPKDCGILEKDGMVRLDRSRYLKRSWARRNVRLNPGRSIGSHLFPDESTWPVSLQDKDAKQFMDAARKMLDK